MRFRHRIVLGVVAALTASLCARTLGGGRAPEQSPREIREALDAVRVDPAQVYPAAELRLRRDTVNLSFIDGTIGFLEAYDGRVTGMVFTGRGHVSANLRDTAEKASLARFLGFPLLDLTFSGAYLRFDDTSAVDILDQLRRDGVAPQTNDEFVADWNKSLPNLNPTQSPRLLLNWMTDSPLPYFYAELLDERLGAFDLLVDKRRSDSVLVGQNRWANGNRYYDVWTSFRGNDSEAPTPPSFSTVSYMVDTTIEPDRTLKGITTIELRAERGGDRSVPLELSRFLNVESAQDGDGNALDIFQNEILGRGQRAERSNDLLFVFLPEAPAAGQTVRLRIAYRGSVISDAGNGVFFVGDRGSWYPHGPFTGQFAAYDTTFHWPRKLQLVATGEKIEEHEEGEQRVGKWRSEGRAPIAGFNLGDYKFENVDAPNGTKIEVAANAPLEKAILDRLRSQQAAGSDTDVFQPLTRPRRGQMPVPDAFVRDSPTPVAGALREVGQEIANAIRFEQQWMGPFPYRRLVVSQTPGPAGQGFPGLLYLPYLSFFTVFTQQRAGVSDNAQEMLNAVVPYHEVAHQWWGNVVGWDSYRDQWLTEGLANYIAVVGADAQHPNSHLLAHWLDRYRNELTAPASGQKEAADDAGPLVHGFRLSSSRDPGAYEKVIYGKGTWVFHMLRMMLQDPSAKNPDERFIGLLKALLESHKYRALTTEELQKAVERVMTPDMDLEGSHSMDWFFDQYVRSTGIPAYEVEFTAQPGSKGFQVRGTLTQKNVPEDFVLRVPIYAQAQSGKPVLLGNVVTSGEKTPFQFVAATSPRKLLVDPQQTLLCVLPASSSPAAE